MSCKVSISILSFSQHMTDICSILADLAPEIIGKAQDTNNMLASAGVKFLLRNHYTDLATGTNGIEALIKNILMAHGAVWPKNVEDTTFRHMAIAGSMLTEDIILEVRNTFGEDRYPDSTIRMYLSSFGEFGKIQMTGKEDKDRTCARPRCKWYVAQ